jgi:hypothetical protein
MDTPYNINDPKELAQQSVEFAFTMPTGGSACDVPIGFVPYTMNDLENIAVSMLTNGPGWFNGDSPIYDHPDTPVRLRLSCAIVGNGSKTTQNTKPYGVSAMRLFQATVNMDRQHHDLPLLLPAFDAQTCENKVRNAINNGTLFFKYEHTQTNKHTGQEETVIGTARITGIVNTVTCEEVCNPAFPRRKWDENANRFRYARPVSLKRLGRSLAYQFRNADMTKVSAYSQGWKDATRDYSSKCKTHEAKLRAALKAYKGQHPDEYEAGFLKQWTRLASKLANAKTTTKTTSKKPRKSKKATQAA